MGGSCFGQHICRRPYFFKNETLGTVALGIDLRAFGDASHGIGEFAFAKVVNIYMLRFVDPIAGIPRQRIKALPFPNALIAAFKLSCWLLLLLMMLLLLLLMLVLLLMLFLF